MALTFNRVLNHVITDAEPEHGTTVTSAEIDIGDDTLVEQIWLHLRIASWGTAPTSGNFQVGIQPLETTSGTLSVDGAISFVGAIAADAAYAFSWPVASLPRYFKVVAFNNTANGHPNANTVQVYLEYVAVTA